MCRHVHGHKLGANDVATNVGAAVGSGALTMAGALAIAVISGLLFLAIKEIVPWEMLYE